MKVLLISVTAGYGHHSTANAVADELEKRGIELRKIDLLESINKFYYKAVDKGYLLSAKYAPRQFGKAYHSLERSNSQSRFVNDMIAELLAKKFYDYFNDYDPDVVICTHVFAAQVMDELKRRNLVSVPVIGIVTDYTLHPFWEKVPRIDYIVIASELISHRCQMRGIHPSRILPFGIPIRPKFLTKLPKEEARKLLGLNVDTNTILIMSGSMGYGNMTEVVRRIDALEMPLQLLIVCGNNKKMYKKLEAFTFLHPTHLFGFVDNVDVMMDAADCIVSKPGGLTTSETLAKKLPMIMVNPIPGQEEDNVDYLLNTGMALHADQNFPVDEAVYYLFSNPRRLQLIEETIDLFSHPDATQRLCDFIEEKYSH